MVGAHKNPVGRKNRVETRSDGGEEAAAGEERMGAGRGSGGSQLWTYFEDMADAGGLVWV